MSLLIRALLTALGLGAVASMATALDSLDLQIDCPACADWNRPVAPFRLAPNTWYVGTEGLAALLIDSGSGLILLDGGLPQTAPRIATSIRQLGFDPGQLRWIGNSHAHFDHAGGLAALVELSGAKVFASARGAEVLARGELPADDPQAAPGNTQRYPAVLPSEVWADGETRQLGAIKLTAHYTPGHAPGGTSWSWPACDADGACVSVVYADSLTAVSADGFRFSDHPDRVAALRASIATVAALDCDVVVSTHPEFVQLFERQRSGRLVEGDGCQRYAAAAQARLETRLAQETESR